MLGPVFLRHLILLSLSRIGTPATGFRHPPSPRQSRPLRKRVARFPHRGERLELASEARGFSAGSRGQIVALLITPELNEHVHVKRACENRRDCNCVTHGNSLLSAR